jgi:ATP-binding cassette subfamily C protein
MDLARGNRIEAEAGIPAGPTRAVFRYFLRRYRLASAVLVALLVLAGIAEGIGLLSLLPLLQTAIEGEPADGLAERAILGVLDFVGLEGGLASLLVVLVVALWLKGVFRWIALRQVGNAVAGVARDFRLRLMRALLRAQWRHFATERSGELANALSRDAFWASYAYRHAVGMVAAGIQLIVYSGVVVLISWRLGALALAAAAVLALVLGVFVGMSRRAGAEQTRLSRSLVSRLLDVVGGLKAIKAMGRERWYLPILEDQTRELERAERRQVLAVESLRAFQEPLLALLLAPLVYLALTRTDVAFATLVLAVFLLHRLLGRAHVVQAEYQGVAAAEAAFDALNRQIAAAESEPDGVAAGGAPPRLDERLELRDVSFAYDGRPVLRSVSLTIPARRITALVGTSGAGKTTLLDVLMGLRNPDAGLVLVDGVPLESLDAAAWRSRIGYVPQEPILLDESIARNVALGQTVPEAEIERALDRAGALSFVRNLPGGLHTTVGERGATLSGGERQRLAIARALLHDPLVLVLDEATSELDPATEAEFCATLEVLRGEVTVVAVSHRSAIVSVADHRYELVNGRVIEGSAP